MFEDARQDLEFALRSLRREPGVAMGIVVTFALAIGANAAMVSLVARLMTSTLPGVAEPSAVARLSIQLESPDGERYAMTTTSYPAFRTAHSLEGAFSAVAAARPLRLTSGVGAEMRELSVIAASGEYFHVLGARPALGRFFDTSDDALPAGNAVAVLSHLYWERQHAGSTSVLGTHIAVDGVDYTIVGVAPPGFTGDDLAPVDLFVPLTVVQRKEDPNWITDPGMHFLSVIARVHDRRALPAGLATLTASLRSGAHEDKIRTVKAAPLLADSSVSPRQAEIARWLALVSFIVLLVAVANVATLLLLRAARRRREMAVRLALGASRFRLARQLLVEGWLLAALGGGAALLVAHWVADVVRLTLVPNIARSEQLFEPGALAATLIAVCIAGIGAGLAPLAHAGQGQLAGDLRTGGGTTGSFALQRTLISVQVALCTILLFGAGVFVRSLQRLEAQDLGFSTARLMLVTLDFHEHLSGVERDRVYHDVAARLTGMPGVTGATIVQSMPFGNFNVPPISVPGRAEPPSVGGQLPYMYAATAGYLKLMGVRLRDGRLFSDQDRQGSALVVLVNETMARTLWPGESAIGKCIRVGFDPSAEPSPLAPVTLPCREIVGVVRDSRVRSLRATGSEGKLMQYYIPFGQQPAPFMADASQVSAVLVRVSGDPGRIAAPVQRLVQGAAGTPVYATVRPYEDLLDPQIRPWRLGATLFSALGFLALTIAAIGLFAVVSYLVTQRLREIGIRLALGGTLFDVVRLIVSGALRLVGIGAVVGTIGAFALAPLVQPLLFETSVHDVDVLASICGVLTIVALAAAALPAWRAARVNPRITLQSE
jgi:predicted permease